ncbi:MAG: hypothetical protein NZL90_05090 [Aquificaceae bacterium]|nr:hypothetical protein [Aquificaceae bacterium]MDW8237665.1 hypothetical protein [Aquificaceae bacterium]
MVIAPIRLLIKSGPVEGLLLLVFYSSAIVVFLLSDFSGAEKSYLLDIALSLSLLTGLAGLLFSAIFLSRDS